METKMKARIKKAAWVALCFVLSYYVSMADEPQTQTPSILPASLVPERDQSEYDGGVTNNLGQLTWSRQSDWGAGLWIGARGTTIPVVDPYSIKKPTIRPAAEHEYTIVLGPGTSFATNGVVLFDDELPIDSAVERHFDIVPAGRRDIARVDVTNVTRAVVGYPNTRVMTNGAVRVSLSYDAMLPPPDGESRAVCVVGGIRVHVFENDLHDVVYDFTNGDVKMVDTVGDVTIGTIREWVNDTYWRRSGEYWSDFPARSDASVAGKRLFLSDDFWFRRSDDIGANPNTLILYGDGKPLVRFQREYVSVTTNSVTGTVSQDYLDYSTNGLFKITSFDDKAGTGPDGSRVEIITVGFPEVADEYEVYGRDSIDGVEELVASGTNSPITFVESSMDRRFYKVRAKWSGGDIEVDTDEVTVDAAVRIDADLYVRGVKVAGKSGISPEAVAGVLEAMSSEGGIESGGKVYRFRTLTINETELRVLCVDDAQQGD